MPNKRKIEPFRPKSKKQPVSKPKPLRLRPLNKSIGLNRPETIGARYQRLLSKYLRKEPGFIVLKKLAFIRRRTTKQASTIKIATNKLMFEMENSLEKAENYLKNIKKMREQKRNSSNYNKWGNKILQAELEIERQFMRDNEMKFLMSLFNGRLKTAEKYFKQINLNQERLEEMKKQRKH